MTQASPRDRAIALFESWSSPAVKDAGGEASPNFCTEMYNIAMDNVFAGLWLREALDLRGRSLLTLGMLIALHAEDELKAHFAIALKNGCTVQELEEVIYHSTAYAGFPAANIARRTAVATLRAEGVID